MHFLQGHNEQAIVHTAAAFARETRRAATLAVTSSIGPGATNMVTGAALAAINRLPVLLLPSDTYATRRQGPVLQQLESPVAGDVSVNDCFRPVSRYFDRIQRPEQLLVALPEAMRVLTDPRDTGAVTLALPQDIQAHAGEFPLEFFAERTWSIARTHPEPRLVAECAALLANARRPLIIAGGGIWYSGASAELEQVSFSADVPVAETFAGKGSMSTATWRTLGGIGVEGTRPANAVAADADLVVCVGTRMADFITGSQSLFKHPQVRFVAINVDARDAHKQGALGIEGDAKVVLVQLLEALANQELPDRRDYRHEIEILQGGWQAELNHYLAPEQPMSGGSVIRALNQQARPGDVIITAAGAPPGELLKLWDANGGRRCHIEFGYSCMGYELPAGLGARLTRPDGAVVVLVGDGSFLINAGEIVTLAQERARVTVVVLDNQGYQVIRRLQLKKTGVSFGNEFRVRESPLAIQDDAQSGEGDYVQTDLVTTARGLGATVFHADNPADLRQALAAAHEIDGPVVIVVPVEKQRWLPDGGSWWDVAPAEVSSEGTVNELRREYVQAREAEQRFYPPSTVATATYARPH
jgi:3D-(3,5/4)-trihydroxycyclohexane-1,2-dione acylhydrolase (decyclizing)